ncbi:MAG: diaminopimelate epimerase [Flavobacteriales bacterium]
MEVKFYKYQGTGNDFVMIDNRELLLDKSDISIAKQLCDRRFGIGADGLILIENHPNADFDMIYFNGDGTQSFCGNGSRCAVSFANFLGIINNETTFNAIDGMHDATFNNEKVELKMGDVSSIEKDEDYFFIHTGSPHYIEYRDDISDLDIVTEAHKIRYNDRFREEGTNVNYVQKQSDNSLKMRTYERGVEGETLSCGTGATAVALSGVINYQLSSPISIHVPGGELSIKFNQVSEEKFEDIWLIGPAVQVFEGVVEI